jgi:DNA polymerase-4
MSFLMNQRRALALPKLLLEILMIQRFSSKNFLRLTEKATARLRSSGLFAKTISIKVRYADFTTINRSKTLPLPINTAHDTYDVVKSLYQALKIDGARLRLIGVALENFSEDAPEQMSFDTRDKSWRHLQTALDKARNRFGGGSVHPARLIPPGGKPTASSQDDERELE